MSGPGPVTSDGTDDDEIPQNSLSRNNSPPMGNSGPNFAALDNIGRLLQIANGEASPKDTPVRLTSMSTAVRDSSAVMQQPQQHDDRMSRALRYSNRQAENLAQLKLAAGPQTQQLPNEPTSPKHFHNANHDLTIQLESGLATNVRKTTAEGRLAADSQTALADVTQLQQDIDRLRKRSRSLATKVAAARKDDEKVTAELARAASKHAACVAATKVRAAQVSAFPLLAPQVFVQAYFHDAVCVAPFVVRTWLKNNVDRMWKTLWQQHSKRLLRSWRLPSQPLTGKSWQQSCAFKTSNSR